MRFELAVAAEEHSTELRGLGTYGLIRGQTGFIIGAVFPGGYSLEDYGFAMEYLVLYATHLGLGTCWLGGNFTRSTFSKRIHTSQGETVPAVAAVGYAAHEGRARDHLRRHAKSDSRRPWEEQFFWSAFGNPLPMAEAGEYLRPLNMVRLSPSAHNHQPWRVVAEGGYFHFYLRRTPGYGPGTPAFTMFAMADLQRLEMGIAMCHFELMVRELGLSGAWEVHEPSISKPDTATEYVASWGTVNPPFGGSSDSG